LIYYFRIAHTSQKNKTRIIDLLVVGVVLWISSKLRVYVKIDPLETAGILVFAYAWGILIVEKLWEGLKGNDQKQHPD